MTRVHAHGIPSSILLAPDKFKGTFSAAEVTAALARGITQLAGTASAHPLEVDACPVADGGEGTLAALTDALGLERVRARASDPLGRSLEAEFGLGAHGVAVIEVAAANGLALLRKDERDPLTASSYGTGELIAAAVAAGARELYLAAGGSATVDGGEGVLRALRDLVGTHRFEPGTPGAVRLTVLCDVRTPFERAAHVFGPQKGANPAMVELLAQRLERIADAAPRDPRGVPGTGAAGGLAGGLWAGLGARLVPGAPFVLDAVAYDARMRAARAVISGEGRLDRQSLAGKALCEVATRARQAGVPSHAVVGVNALDRFDARILDLQLVLSASTLAEIEAAGAQIAEHILGENARGR